MSHFSTILTTLCIGLFGCNQPKETDNPPDVGGPSSLITWAASADEPAGTVFRLGDVFAVWSDFPTGGSCNTSSNLHGLTCQGYFKTPRGGQVAFVLESKDGKTGEVKINGESYELKDGELFLLTDTPDSYRVKQVKRDLSEIDFESDVLRELARNDEQLKAFFNDSQDDSPSANQ